MTSAALAGRTGRALKWSALTTIARCRLPVKASVSASPASRPVAPKLRAGSALPKSLPSASGVTVSVG